MELEHSRDAFIRSRFLSFTQCGEDRFQLTHLLTGDSALVGGSVVLLLLSVDEDAPMTLGDLHARLERAWTSPDSPGLDEATRDGIRASVDQLTTLGALEPVGTHRGYDAVADDYDARETPLDPAIERLVAKTARHHREGVVLEVGCGTGQVLERLAAFAPTRLHGIDVSRSMIERARAKLASAPIDVQIQQARAEHLPFASDSIDLVVVATALHWFDQAAFWSEVRRVAAADHRIVIWDTVLAGGVDNPLTEYFGQRFSREERDAILRRDATTLLSELPPWVGVHHFERLEVVEPYATRDQLERVVRSWCPPEEAALPEALVVPASATWPLEVPFAMSVAVLEVLER